jgi:glutamate synthase domain-containing protein 2
MERFLESVASARVRAIEIKLSQGAKPGLGGLLPAAKITPEIARIRGIPRGRDCVSPANHTAFRDVSSLLDFIERLADATGLPVGIKSAVGDLGFWRELAGSASRSAAT